MVDIAEKQLCTRQLRYDLQLAVPQGVEDLLRLVLPAGVPDGGLADLSEDVGEHHAGQTQAHSAGAVGELDVKPHNNHRLIKADELHQGGIDLCADILKLERDIVLPAAA